MWQKLRLFFYNHRSWVYTLQYVFYSLLVLILVLAIDFRWLPIGPYLPSFLSTSVELAKSILSTLAGALLTITTFTFSTILAVLTLYSANYTPRSIENFAQKRITMKVLGIFIGGFFYSISALAMMRDSFGESRVTAGLVAVLYSVVCVIYFIIFVQRVIRSVQPANLVQDIFAESSEILAAEVSRRRSMPQTGSAPGLKILAPRSGYLALIDSQALLRKLEGQEVLVSIERRIGEYILKGERLGYLYFTADRNRLPEEAQTIRSSDVQALAGYLSGEAYQRSLLLPGKEGQEGQEAALKALSAGAQKLFHLASEAFILQAEKVGFEDYRHGLQKLSEISLRALSPGINDPATAVHCIRKMSILLSRLALVDPYHVLLASEGGCQIFCSSYRLEEDLYSLLWPILHYGQQDLQIALTLMEALGIIRHSASRENYQTVCNFRQAVLGLLEKSLERTEWDYLQRVLSHQEQLLDSSCPHEAQVQRG